MSRKCRKTRFPRRTLLETVWKIRMGFTLGSHEALKGGEKPPYWPLLRHQNTRFRPIQLFTKQFQSTYSRKVGFRHTGFSETWRHKRAGAGRPRLANR